MLRSILLAGVLALSACASTTGPTASATQPGGRDCFRSTDVSGYNVVDDHHVSLSVGARRHYILTTDWNVRDLNWSEQIALHSGIGWICTGNGLGVEVSGGQPHRTYPVSGIARAPDPAPQGS
jgi:hypothetical protein